MKRRQHGHVPFPFLVSYSLTDFLRIMVKGGGEERREGVREGEEEKKKMSYVRMSRALPIVMFSPILHRHHSTDASWDFPLWVMYRTP